MSYIESIFCNKREYDINLSNKIDEQQLEAKGLYTGMFSLENAYMSYEAAKMPVRIEQIDPREIGGRILYIATLDSDLQPNYKTQVAIENGYFQDINEALSIVDVNSGEYIGIQEGYLMDYGNGLDGTSKELFDELNILQVS